MIRCLTLSISIAMLFSIYAAPAALPVKMLVTNGDFEVSQDGRNPDGWGLPEGATWEKDGDNHFLRLKSPKPGATVMVYRAVALTPDIKALELGFRVRYEGIKRGKESWFDARIMANFKDANKQVLQPGPPHPAFTGTAAEWKQPTHRFRVPEDATTLELMFTLFQAQSGQIDFDDIKLMALDTVVLDAAEAAAKAKETARCAASASSPRSASNRPSTT